MSPLRFFAAVCVISFQLAGSLPGAFGQTPSAPATAAASKSVYIDVMDRAGTSDQTVHWRSAAGSSERTLVASRQITITVRNMSSQLPGDFEVEWFLVAKKANGQWRWVYDKGSQKLGVKPGGFEKIEVSAKELSNWRYNSVYRNRTFKSGEKADGWIVRVKSGDQVIRSRCSDNQLEQIEKDPGQLKAFLARRADP